LQDFIVEEISAERLNYSLIKISARNAKKETMLEIELHHSHFKFAPVLAATNEQLTLEKIDFMVLHETSSHKTGRRLFAQERRMPVKREQQKIALPEAHELINVSNLGLGNGDTLRCNLILESLLGKNQASIRDIDGAKNIFQRIGEVYKFFFTARK
jgi:hypothetical protein